MALYGVQNFIYRNLVKRPKVANALDKLGGAINQGLKTLGLSQRYATGLTRNKAALHASGDTQKAKEAGRALIASGRARVLKEVREDLRKSFDLPYPVKEVEKAGGLSLAQAHDLIWKIWGGTAPFDNRRSFEKLLPVLEASKKAGNTPEQTADLIGRVVDNSRSFTSYAFDALPELIEEKFTHDQMAEICGLIAEHSLNLGRNWGTAYRHFGEDPVTVHSINAAVVAFEAVQALIDKSMTPERITATVKAIVKTSNRTAVGPNTAYSLFAAIRNNVRNGMDLPPLPA